MAMANVNIESSPLHGALANMERFRISLPFTVLDVFTKTRFQGNTLAVVFVPNSASLTPIQKLQITREFNFSETVFISPPTIEAHNAQNPISIYTTSGEVPFAGHPTVGAAWLLRHPMTLLTPAGPVRTEVDSATGIARVNVPFMFRMHSEVPLIELLAEQPTLIPADLVETAVPVAAIVHGMTFMLMGLAREEALARMQPYSTLPSVRWQRVEDQNQGLVAIYAYWIERKHAFGGNIMTRMFEGERQEDPATGSAACALGCYLSYQEHLRSGESLFLWNIVQGVAMGRRSEIKVIVELKEGAIKRVQLEGHAVEVMTGTITV